MAIVDLPPTPAPSRPSTRSPRPTLASVTVEQLLTAEELATLLRKSPDAIYKMAERDQIPHIRIGRCLRFSPSAVNVWIAERARASSVAGG